MYNTLYTNYIWSHVTSVQEIVFKKLTASKLNKKMLHYTSQANNMFLSKLFITPTYSFSNS